MTVSIEVYCKIPEDELRIHHSIVQFMRDMNAASRKLRKTCATCRWPKLERNGTNSHGISFWYCKFRRSSFNFLPDNDIYCCEHYKRKGQSK